MNSGARNGGAARPGTVPSRTSAAAIALALAAPALLLRGAAASNPPDSDGSACPPRASLATAAISFDPGGQTADVWSVPLGGGSPRKLASLPRAPHSAVTGTVVPGTALVVVAVSPHRERDPTWSGSVYVVGPEGAPRPVLRQAYAGGPLVASAAGEVFAVRGAAGLARSSPGPGGYRTDRLELVAIDARSGAVRTVRVDQGDAFFPIGLAGRELIGSRVGASQTGVPVELVAVDTVGGTVRSLTASTPQLARDFSLDRDAGLLWFTGLRAHARDGGRWAVYGLELASGKLAVAATGESMALLPRAWPGGKVAFRCGDGLCVADLSGRRDRLQVMGARPDQVQAVICTREGEVVLGGEDRGRFTLPLLWETANPLARPMALPHQRILFIGALHS
jgi:hypothetical protein